MVQKFDAIVVGTGAAGSTVAYKCAAAGWKVAVVDERPYGGTCALRGCDPKKVLVGAAEIAEATRRMAGKGAPTGSDAIVWKELAAFKRSFVEGVPASRERGYKDAGIATFHGTARFTGRTGLQVGADALEAPRIVLATGARPMPLGFPGAEHVATSDDFLDLQELPARIVFIGGGFISFEFAHVAVRAGAKVTILHRSERPLKEFDADLVKRLVEASRDAGIDVRLDAPVERVEREGNALVVVARGERHVCDLAVHGAGRVPNLDGLDLRAGGVEAGPRGVKVDKHLRSVSNPAVHAAGDCADAGLPLTPIAGLQGDVVADNLLHDARREADPGPVGTAVFAIPTLARVGLLEEEARSAGLRFRVAYADTTAWYSARRTNARASGYKILIEEGTDLILGAHLLGPAAEDVINLFLLAMRHKIPARELRSARYAYPSRSWDLTYMLG